MAEHHEVGDHIKWESGANQLTRTDLEEGVAIAAVRNEVITEKKVSQRVLQPTCLLLS